MMTGAAGDVATQDHKATREDELVSKPLRVLVHAVASPGGWITAGARPSAGCLHGPQLVAPCLLAASPGAVRLSVVSHHPSPCFCGTCFRHAVGAVSNPLFMHTSSAFW